MSRDFHWHQFFWMMAMFLVGYVSGFTNRRSR